MDQLFEKMLTWENFYQAFKKAAKGKRGKANVAEFEYKVEDNLLRLIHELKTKSYKPGDYFSFYIHEPKKRLISAAPFRDRVVHHALCRIIEPLFERSFIYDSYANRKDKGTHRALDRVQHYARRYKYVLQCDIEQFFPAIDHEVLKNILHKVIKDDDVCWLIDLVLQFGENILSEVYDIRYFPGDDLFAAARPRGLPIGNLTSQFWANCYLNGFDHFIKRELRIPGYLRYVDDFLLFHNDKKILREAKGRSIARLHSLRLTMHENSAQVRPVQEGIPFLGFIVYPTHRRLKRRKGIYFQRKLRHKISLYQNSELDFNALKASITGWINHVSYGDTWGLRRDVLGRNPIKGNTHGRRNDYFYADV
ncbi:group II intron reverse transcriptase domain-containing protein [candidate division KSB1 bacterium]|nr:group II intron reverse transcriptase domain-containing protein [candidate division KSB1 bacterium]